MARPGLHLRLVDHVEHEKDFNMAEAAKTVGGLRAEYRSVEFDPAVDSVPIVVDRFGPLIANHADRSHREFHRHSLPEADPGAHGFCIDMRCSCRPVFRSW